MPIIATASYTINWSFGEAYAQLAKNNNNKTYNNESDGTIISFKEDYIYRDWNALLPDHDTLEGSKPGDSSKIDQIRS